MGGPPSTPMTREQFRRMDAAGEVPDFLRNSMQSNLAPEPPPPPPDLADEEVQRAKKAAMQRLQMGGLPDTFLTGPLGDLTPPATSAPKASGF